MYIIKITEETQSWLVAICLYEEQYLAYMESLSDEVYAKASFFEIEMETFPFVVIENTDISHQLDSYFGISTLEALQDCIETLRDEKNPGQKEPYFKYYYIDEDYFQVNPDQNYMLFLRHTEVTNDFLEKPYVISVFHEEIDKYVTNYDVNGLDKLFEQTKSTHSSKLEKEDLAINGYDSLFWKMYYDYNSDKLTEKGIQCLLPMVEKMEILHDEKRWKNRSYALHIVFETACMNKSETVFPLFRETLEAYDNYLISHPEDKLEIHRLAYLIYRMMIEREPENALLYWENSIVEIKKAIVFNPEKASWVSFLELLYYPFEKDDISRMQTEELNRFNIEIKKLEKERGSVLAYKIALGYQDMKEFMQWKKIENVFPENAAFQWAEKALAYMPEEISRTGLYECAEFFSKTGTNMSRVDFLEKAISLYEQALKTDENNFLEIFYIVTILREIAGIYLQNNQQSLADDAIIQARLMFENNIEKVKSNPSLNLRYAEYLEFCYTYSGNINKPSLSELKSVAEEIEVQSEGFYSYPYGMLTCIALLEGNEAEAILQATKSLILHELCAKATFLDLFKQFKDSQYNQLKAFLDETILFIEEVEENYYYNPELSWEKLNKMSNEALTVYWEKRKEEIRNRPPFDTE
ncbi:hypothetical protein [Flavobacterium limi]|uniref:Tetratricopeptide repeat-containing protein n=1 Tax=Flavobacterium limi TaxID=2045105 RepID=A0ABQ1UL29_9FLAO|nr:hypothetical protein [Flavobacterium limi]GGF21366.1 hypothetical protein GCM10011518_33180 [Flavobacterium limi]